MTEPSRMIRVDPAVLSQLREQPAAWCITGAAGFIGSNLLEVLLATGQRVTAIDNFSTGHLSNLEKVRASVGEQAWAQLRFIEGDIRDRAACAVAVEGVDYVLNQAALGSVPRSISQPQASHESNVDGFLNMLVAARDAGVKRFVYASSSSVYGDSPELPKQEDRIGRPLSPYALTKAINEQYAEVFARCYGMASTGLRYFNVFGPRQDPEGAYAAVIPKWTASLLQGDPVWINGDGETSRDFCHVANAVQANIRSAWQTAPEGHVVYNVAVGHRTTLNELYHLIVAELQSRGIAVAARPEYRDFRAGDVRHSLAAIERIQADTGYAPTHDLQQGLQESMGYYIALYRNPV